MRKKNIWMTVNQDHLLDFIIAFSKTHLSEEDARKISIKNVMDFIDDWMKNNPSFCSTIDE